MRRSKSGHGSGLPPKGRVDRPARGRTHQAWERPDTRPDQTARSGFQKNISRNDLLDGISCDDLGGAGRG